MRQNSDFLLQEVADTVVVVPVGQASVNFGGMITLNTTGAVLWKLLETEQTVQTMTQALLDRYEVEEATARADVEAFIKKLLPTGAILTD